jgi:hypothetical protein
VAIDETGQQSIGGRLPHGVIGQCMAYDFFFVFNSAGFGDTGFPWMNLDLSRWIYLNQQIQ